MANNNTVPITSLPKWKWWLVRLLGKKEILLDAEEDIFLEYVLYKDGIYILKMDSLSDIDPSM